MFCSDYTHTMNQSSPKHMSKKREVVNLKHDENHADETLAKKVILRRTFQERVYFLTTTIHKLVK